MKSLKNLEQVKKALSAIATSGNPKGMQVKCYPFDTQVIKTQEVIALEREIIKKKFSNVDYTEEYKRMSELPQGKTIQIFKLLEPMTIRGSKQVVIDGKSITPEVKNCTEIYIPEDIINNDLAGLQYEETDEKEIDASGQEVPVIVLDLGKCMIDIASGKRDWKDRSKWIQAPRAYVTDISFRSMQIIGSMLARDERTRNAALDYLSDDQLVNS